MAKVLKDEATAMKLMVVSGTTKEGDWKETHVNVLLEEIVDTYTKLYGKESRESDIESDGSSEAEEVEEDGEED